MRLRSVSSITVESAGASDESVDPLFVMFHGYGNSESEMIRILDGLVPQGADHADYVAYRGVLERDRFLGGYAWFPSATDPDPSRRPGIDG